MQGAPLHTKPAARFLQQSLHRNCTSETHARPELSASMKGTDTHHLGDPGQNSYGISFRKRALCGCHTQDNVTLLSTVG